MAMGGVLEEGLTFPNLEWAGGGGGKWLEVRGGKMWRGVRGGGLMKVLLIAQEELVPEVGGVLVERSIRGGVWKDLLSL